MRKLVNSRSRCPFYGMYFAPLKGNPLLISTPGNRCAWYAESHAPCQMEFNDLAVDWERCCFFNTQENLVNILVVRTYGQAFPLELRPDGASEWQGLTFPEWEQYVMERRGIN